MRRRVLHLFAITVVLLADAYQMETARAEIASGRVDGQELFRRIRRKLAEQRGIVL